MTQPQLLSLLLLVLATYRISRFISQEAGPFDFMATIRYTITRDFSEKSDFWPTLVRCFLCNSVWVSFLLVALFAPVTGTDVLLWGLAVSGAASALWEIVP